MATTRKASFTVYYTDKEGKSLSEPKVNVKFEGGFYTGITHSPRVWRELIRDHGQQILAECDKAEAGVKAAQAKAEADARVKRIEELKAELARMTAPVPPAVQK